jgi:hypothetical protein
MQSDYSLGYEIKTDELVYTSGPPITSFIHAHTVGQLPWPFQPNDEIDYALGFAAMALPYPIIFAFGGPAAVARYSLMAPDSVLFAVGVAASNLFQAAAELDIKRNHEPIHETTDFYSYKYV